MNRNKNIEIERKFLVQDLSFKSLADPVYFVQGYLAQGEKCLVRVRLEGKDAFLCIKGQRINISASEYNYKIDPHDAEEILKSLAEGFIVEKNRYTFPFNGKVWEVDEFLGKNSGLYLAEVELLREDEDIKFPDFVGKELSLDKRFTNVYLSQRPFSSWDKAEQALFRL